MWYFTWVLGIGFAVAFAIINAMWLEAELSQRQDCENS
jgi:cyd operon protein YbgT